MGPSGPNIRKIPTDTSTPQ